MVVAALCEHLKDQFDGYDIFHDANIIFMFPFGEGACHKPYAAVEVEVGDDACVEIRVWCMPTGGATIKISLYEPNSVEHIVFILRDRLFTKWDTGARL